VTAIRYLDNRILFKSGFMKITGPTFNYGQVGLQRSQDKLEQASEKVAQASTHLVSQTPDQATDKTTRQEQPPSERLYGSPIQDGLIEANSSKLEAQANAKVIGASDSNLGTLIDINA